MTRDFTLKKFPYHLIGRAVLISILIMALLFIAGCSTNQQTGDSITTVENNTTVSGNFGNNETGIEFYNLTVTPTEATYKTTLTAELTVRNLYSQRVSRNFTVYINEVPIKTTQVELPPQEKSSVQLRFKPVNLGEGFAHIKIGPMDDEVNLRPYVGGEPLETIRIDGPVELEGKEKRVIENKKVILNGDIRLKDTAQLIFRNSHIFMNGSYKRQYVAILEDNATLVAKESTLDTPPKAQVDIEMRNRETHIQLQDTVSIWKLNSAGTIELNSTLLNSLFWQQSGILRTKESEIETLSVQFPGEGRDYKISNLISGQAIDAKINSRRGTAVFNNTIVHGWVLYPGSLKDRRNNNITIEDSALDALWFHFPPSSHVEFRNFGAGYYENYNLDDEPVKESVGFNLSLVNTSVGVGEYTASIKLLGGGNVTAVNSTDLHIGPYGPARYMIRGSVISYNMMIHGDREKVDIVDSRIEGKVYLLWQPGESHLGAGDTHYLHFNNAVISEEAGIHVASNHTEITGTVDIQTEKVQFDFGIVKRKYPVDVTTSEGKSQAGVVLKLYDSDGEKVWEGKTDDSGRAIVPITFGKQNFSETRVLRVQSPGNVEKKVSLLQSTPISVNIQGNGSISATNE